MAQLVQVLQQANKLRFRLDALPLQLRAVARRDLHRAALALLHRRARAFDPVLLGAEILLRFVPLAAALRQHQPARVAVACQALERTLLLDQNRQCAGELGLRFHRRLHVAPGPRHHGALLGETRLVREGTRFTLRFDLCVQATRGIRQRCEPRTAQLGVDAPQLQPAQCNFVLCRGGIGLGGTHVHAREQLAGTHALAFVHQEFAHHAALRGLHDA